MKKSDTIVSVILVPIDFLALVLAGISAYFLRFETVIKSMRQIYYKPPFEEYLNVVFFVAFVSIIVFAFLGLYAITSTRRKIDEIAKIFAACSTSITAAILIAIFFKLNIIDSRFIILAAWLLAMIYVGLARMIVRFIQRIFHTMGIGAVRVAIIGNDTATYDIINAFKSKPGFGYKIVKHFKDYNDDVKAELIKMMKNREIEQVIKADTSIDKGSSLDLIDLTAEYNIIFKFAADLLNTQTTNTRITTYAGVPIIEIKKTRLEGWGKVAKRIVDIIGSLILIIITSPIMLIEAIAIKLDSKGPIIYLNERIGEKGKKFNVYKFRSMKIESCVGPHYKDTDKALELEKELIAKKNVRSGPLYKIKDDPRVTRVGKFIRKTSIDEFPQFFNVLFGSMSLVGPRPHQPREVEKYERHHKRVLDIKPGITGIPQISGRSDLDFDEEVKLDTYYIENWSILMDLWLLVKTPFAVLFKPRKAL